MKIEPSITVRSILYQRPRSVAIFEAVSGSIFWHHLDANLSSFAQVVGSAVPDLVRRLGELKPAATGQDWGARPLYDLIDHLREDHEDFRGRHLPIIEQAFHAPALGHLEPSHPLALAGRDFQSFTQDFLWHMKEEEDFIFPKLLRIDSCFRHPELYTEIQKGNVGLYPNALIHSPEQHFKHFLAELRDSLRNHAVEENLAKETYEIREGLETFELRLLSHVFLETDRLFPTGIRLEKEVARKMRMRMV